VREREQQRPSIKKGEGDSKEKGAKAKAGKNPPKMSNTPRRGAASQRFPTKKKRKKERKKTKENLRELVGSH